MGILVIASVFRESLPWIYELGVNAYQALQNNSSKTEKTLKEFAKAIDFTIHNPHTENILSKEENMTLIGSP